MSFTLKAITGVYVTRTDAVIYTNGHGGGPNEYEASNNPARPAIYQLEIPRTEGRPVAAWYTPWDNIADLVKFTYVNAVLNGPTVELQIASRGEDARTRIVIHILKVTDALVIGPPL